MLYTGSAIYNGQPLPSATLVFKNQQGVPIAVIPVDASGSYSIDTEFNSGLFTAANTAEFSAPGFSTYRISAQTIPENFQVALSKSINPAVALGLGAAAALLIAAKPGKKGMLSGFKFNIPPMAQGIIGIGLLGVGYYLLFYKKGQGGLLKTQADARLQQLAAAGISSTLTAPQVEGIASTIVQAVDDCGTDETAIFSAVEQLSNEADLMRLISTYGVRDYKGCFEGSYFGSVSHNLAETLTSELSAGDLATVNNILSSNGIPFKF